MMDGARNAYSKSKGVKEMQEAIDELREKIADARDHAKTLDFASREMSLVITKLDEAELWASRVEPGSISVVQESPQPA